MNKTLFMLLCFFAVNSFAQDTLKMIRSSENLVSIGIISKSPVVEISDSVARLNTAKDISKLYNTGWTAANIKWITDRKQFPSRIDQLNANMSKTPYKGTGIKDSTFYDWIELGYKNALARSPELYKQAKKSNKLVSEQTYQPWVLIIINENYGYKTAEIRKELQKRKITRVYFEMRNPNIGMPYGEEVGDPVPPPPPPIEKKPSGIAELVDEPASFPGGTSALKKYLDDNLVYPESAKAANLQGKVYTKFVVKKDGTITDITISRNMRDCPECDAEAIRLIKAMPKWLPGKVSGKPVDSYFNLPVTFKLL